MVLRMGKPGALFLWVFVCFTAFFVVQTALQANSRMFYAHSPFLRSLLLWASG